MVNPLLEDDRSSHTNAFVNYLEATACDNGLLQRLIMIKFNSSDMCLKRVLDDLAMPVPHKCRNSSPLPSFYIPKQHTFMHFTTKLDPAAVERAQYPACERIRLSGLSGKLIHRM